MFSTFQAAQEDLRARRAKTRRAEAHITVRWSEASERNEAYEAFQQPDTG